MIDKQREQGFVLATSLVMLMLMTMLITVIYMSIDSSRKSTAAAETSTEAFYYAETAVNYMSWSLYNNVEFDSFVYPNPVRTDLAGIANNSFAEPADRAAVSRSNYITDHKVTGDWKEWMESRGNPSGDDTFIENGVGHPGQLMYYDNSPSANRVLFLRGSKMFSPGNNNIANRDKLPDMFEIRKKLPRYIMLSIDNNGNVTPSMPPYQAALPHHGDVMGVDYPQNGAVVWLTGGNRTDDHVIDPIDHYYADIFNSPAVYAGLNCTTGALGTPGAPTTNDIACNAETGAWMTGTQYGLVIYAIGYANGRASKIIRLVYN